MPRSVTLGSPPRCDAPKATEHAEDDAVEALTEGGGDIDEGEGDVEEQEGDIIPRAMFKDHCWIGSFADRNELL
jgi:hypothetical protein